MGLDTVYTAKTYDLSDLNGISNETLAMHFKLYEGYVTNTNLLNEKIADFIRSGNLDAKNIALYSELKRRMDDLKELIEFIAKALVDDPDAVEVEAVEGEKTVILELTVGDGDLGKVIGKDGRTARALRTLLAASSAKHEKRAVLEILE